MTPTVQDLLALDAEATAATIASSIVRSVGSVLRRRGAVVGVSGGVDSAVCAALAARALGPERVLALLMPEGESDPGSTERGHLLCDQLGLETIVEDIGPTLEASGCYRRRDDAIRRLFPEYGPGHRQKITVAADPRVAATIPYFNLTVEAPDGERATRRLPADVYLDIVAATNLKQRTRTMLEYLHADRTNRAVLGTPNRLEYALGFFVRGGDGLADLKPIAHLYKTQVYALAEHLGVPEEIRVQPPTTDTYTLPQTQEEFYFALPYEQLDLVLCGWEHGLDPGRVARDVGLEPEQVARVYRDIVAKRRVAYRGVRDALLVEPVELSERPSVGP